MQRFIAMLTAALTVVVISAVSAVPAFAQPGSGDNNNTAGANNVQCNFPDTGNTTLVDADVCVSTGGIIVDVL
jgi:hypothetical protein